MNDLANLLMNAGDICRKAFAHFEAADQYLKQYNEIMKKLSHTKLLCLTVGMGIYLAVSYGFSYLRLYVLGWVIILLDIVFFLLYYRKQKKLLMAEADKLDQQCRDEAALGEKVLRHHKDQLAFLPKDYCYPLAVEHLTRIASSGRATTIKEAIGKFKKQVNHWAKEKPDFPVYLQLKEQEECYNYYRGKKKKAEQPQEEPVKPLFGRKKKKKSTEEKEPRTHREHRKK